MSADEPPESELLIPNEELPSFLNPSTGSWFTEDPHLYKLYKKHLPVIPFYYRYFPVERIDWPKIEHYLSQGFRLRDLFRLSVNRAIEYRGLFRIYQGEVLIVSAVLLFLSCISAIILGPINGALYVFLSFLYLVYSYLSLSYRESNYQVYEINKLLEKNIVQLLRGLLYGECGANYKNTIQLVIYLFRASIDLLFSYLAILFLFLLLAGLLIIPYLMLFFVAIISLYGIVDDMIFGSRRCNSERIFNNEFNNSLEDYLLLLECYKSKYRDQNVNWYSGYEEKLVQIFNRTPRLTKAERQKLLHIIGKN